MYPLVNDFRLKMGIMVEPETGVRPLPITHGLDGDAWAEQEFGGAELGDYRLTRRLVKIVGQKGQLQGLPYSQAAQGDRYDIKGYYYFIDSKKDSVNFEQILGPHRGCVIRRMASLKTVLVVQDTTDLNYTMSRECKGLGSIGTNQTKAEAKGLSLHSCLAFTEEGLPLGVLNAACCAPKPREIELKKSEKRHIPMEEKKTYKWLESYLDCVAVARTIPDTRIISTMDRDADIFELYEHVIKNKNKVPVLIRAHHDRRLSDSPYKLWEDVAQNGHSFEANVTIPPQRKRYDKRTNMFRENLPKRTACLRISYKKVHLKPPSDTSTMGNSPVTLYAVYATEENPPEKAVQIDWMLLTTLDVANDENALQCILFYKKRWRIEEWHRVMKTGCGVEKYRFRDAKRIKRALAIDMVVSWRVMFLTLSGRNTPNADAEMFFNQDECSILTEILKKSPQ